LKPVRFIFERGITIHLQDDGRWYFRASEKGSAHKEINPNDVAEAYKLLPVLITFELVEGTNVDFLLPKHIRSQLIDIGVSELSQSYSLESGDLGKVLNLGYITGAVIYHCKNLASIYSDICLRFSQMAGDHVDGRRVIFSNQPEAYYEFDALITAARRSYDTTRYILWKYFGPGVGSVPASFKKCLPQCTGLPAPLKLRLSSSWDNYGEHLTDYRDCIQHYVPVDFGMSSANMTRLSDGVWSVSLLIPDNPKAKSKPQLSYSNKIDALSYSWEIATEVVDVAREIILEASKHAGRSAQSGKGR
jgi:hypothetical protein